jgi:hypothetical protein
LWDLLRRSCRKQITELEEFQTSYESKLWAVLRDNEPAVGQQANEAVKKFSEAIETLKRAYSEGLETLTNTSQDLIQLVLDKPFKWKAVLTNWGRNLILLRLRKRKGQPQRIRA